MVTGYPALVSYILPCVLESGQGPGMSTSSVWPETGPGGGKGVRMARRPLDYRLADTAAARTTSLKLSSASQHRAGLCRVSAMEPGLTHVTL